MRYFLLILMLSLPVPCHAANLWALQQGTVINMVVEHCDDNDCDNYDYFQNVGLLISSIQQLTPVQYSQSFNPAPQYQAYWAGQISNLFDSDPYFWNDDSQGDPFTAGLNTITYSFQVTVSSVKVQSGNLNGTVLGLTGSIVPYNSNYPYLTSVQKSTLLAQMTNGTLDLSSLLAADIAYRVPVVAPSGVSAADLASIWSFVLGCCLGGSFCLAVAVPLDVRP